jgi:hypothetical protein
MIERRQFITLAAGAAALTAISAPANACSLTGTRIRRFSDAESRRALTAFVKLLNEAPDLSEEALEERTRTIRPAIGDDLLEGIDGPATAETFFRSYRLSDGKLDPEPIRLVSATLIRQVGNKAAYQFTLRRFSYYAADEEGCNGLFTHDAYYGEEDHSLIAGMENNALTSVRAFPEWPIEPRQGRTRPA